MLISVLNISALLCPIKMKFGMPLRYTLGHFVFKFHKNRMVDDVIMTSFFSVSEHNLGQTDAAILMQFSVNGCLLHWPGPYSNW